MLSIFFDKLFFGVEKFGEFGILSFQVIYFLFRRPFSVINVMNQVIKIGLSSLPVVLITALAVGMIITLQTGLMITQQLPGGKQLLGPIVGVSFVRELGPTFASIMVAGRVGSAIAAELGMMRVTEQLDALVTLAVNPVQYLIVPRFIASVVVFPLVTVMADIIGVFGGGIVAWGVFDYGMDEFFSQTTLFVGLRDFLLGLTKASVFGAIMSLVSCFEGFQSRGGAEGVGVSTTKAVVLSSVWIIISDYLMNTIFVKLLN